MSEIGPPSNPRKFEKEDLADRNKIGHMFFPGSTVSHALVKADPIQKFIMENKYQGIKEFDLYNNKELREAWEYDERPDVVQRRLAAMPWYLRMEQSGRLNHYTFWGFNSLVALAGFRVMGCTSFRQSVWMAGGLFLFSVYFSPGQEFRPDLTSADKCTSY